MERSVSQFLRTTHLSYSKLQSYKKCPRRFKLQYLDGHPSDASREMAVGSVVHATLAIYLESIRGLARLVCPSVEELLQLVPRARLQLRADSHLVDEVVEHEVRPFLVNFARMLPRIDGRAVLHVEAAKRTKVGEYLLLSILDLVLQNERGDLHIIDFKTGNPKYIRKDQLETYSLPILGSPSHNGSPVKLSYLFLRDGKIRSFQMRYDQCEDVVQEIVGTVKRIEQDSEFKPVLSPLCKWCGVRRVCDAYQRGRRR